MLALSKNSKKKKKRKREVTEVIVRRAGKNFTMALLTRHLRISIAPSFHLYVLYKCDNVSSGSSTVAEHTVGTRPLCFGDDNGIVQLYPNVGEGIQFGAMHGLDWSQVRDNPSDPGKERGEGAKGIEELVAAD